MFYLAVTKPELDKVDEDYLKQNLEKLFSDACKFMEKNPGQTHVFYEISSNKTIYFIIKYIEYIKNGGK